MNVSVLNSFLITIKGSFNEGCQWILKGLVLLQKATEEVLETYVCLFMHVDLSRQRRPFRMD